MLTARWEKAGWWSCGKYVILCFGMSNTTTFTPSAMSREGDTIGAYRIVRVLGKGGMGTVYEVEHLRLGVRYALKTFTLESGDVELFRCRFEAEGKILARLRNPHIARVFDLTYDERSKVVYFVMDLVRTADGESRTLADLARGEADENQLIRWFADLASALDYVHAEGIVHRDIKLGNILIDERGGVVLSDFGISRFAGGDLRRELELTPTTMVATGSTGTGHLIVGTRGYLAPELLKGESATVASDSYALGIVFFRLLTGIWYEPGTEAARLLESFDACWKEILPKMLSDDPDARPVQLAPLAARLNATQGGVESYAARRSMKRVGWVLALLAFGAALCGGIAWMNRSVDSVYDHLYDIPESVK